MIKATLLTLLFLSSLLFASPVGNPSFPHAIKEGFFISQASSVSFRVGYEGNFISDQRLIQLPDKKRVNDFSECANSGVLTLNILNRLDLFATYGEAKINTKWIINPEADVFSYIDLEQTTKKIGLQE